MAGTHQAWKAPIEAVCQSIQPNCSLRFANSSFFASIFDAELFAIDLLCTYIQENSQMVLGDFTRNQCHAGPVSFWGRQMLGLPRYNFVRCASSAMDIVLYRRAVISICAESRLNFFSDNNYRSRKMQHKLSSKQVSEFYHDDFVVDQVRHFQEMGLDILAANRVVVDVGGGCGYFCRALKQELGLVTRVIDVDPVSVDSSLRLGVDAILGDALQSVCRNDEGVICFNLILHHLVANSDANTQSLQILALTNWKKEGIKIFVNEYIYDSFIGDISAVLIYLVTKNKILSFVADKISKFIPSLRANTFGVGVRFRSADKWRRVFSLAGFKVEAEVRGRSEFVSLPRRFLLIRDIRRDSFLLSLK